MSPTDTRIRGGFWRTARSVGVPTVIGLLVFMAALLAFSSVPRTMKIATMLVFFVLGSALALLMSAAAALSVVCIDSSVIRFRFCGITLKAIPLASVTGFERLPHIGTVRIDYGTQTYCPNGLFDHDELAHALLSRGIGQRERN